MFRFLFLTPHEICCFFVFTLYFVLRFLFRFRFLFQAFRWCLSSTRISSPSLTPTPSLLSPHATSATCPESARESRRSKRRPSNCRATATCQHFLAHKYVGSTSRHSFAGKHVRLESAITVACCILSVRLDRFVNRLGSIGFGWGRLGSPSRRHNSSACAESSRRREAIKPQTKQLSTT